MSVAAVSVLSDGLSAVLVKTSTSASPAAKPASFAQPSCPSETAAGGAGQASSCTGRWGRRTTGRRKVRVTVSTVATAITVHISGPV